jgi:tripartite-type tricarboxylate transporter receptor subunit TctC
MWRSIALSTALAASAVLSTGAQAQQAPEGYPKRPINMVVVYPAGGGMDVTARVLAKRAEEMLGHEFRVENRVGGGGLVGHTWLANEARPDGYTLGVIASTTMFPDMLSRGGKWTAEDYEPLVAINFDPIIWAVKSDTKYGKMSAKELIDYAKANPGEVKIGITPDNVFQFVTEIVERQTGAKFTHVPFQGGKPGVVALLGGNVDVTNGFMAEVEQYVRNGDLKTLAVADTQKLEIAPDATPLSDAGIDIPTATWGAARVVTVPKGTPPEIKDYLEAGLLKVLRDPATAEAYAKVGMTLSPKGRAEAEQMYQATHKAMRDFLESTGRLKTSN